MPDPVAIFARSVAQDPDMIAYYAELLDADEQRAANAVAFTAKEILERCELFPGNWRQMRQYGRALKVLVKIAARSTEPQQSRWCNDLAEGLRWQTQARWRRHRAANKDG